MAYPTVEAVIAQIGDQLRFVFRHFPLIDMHPHAARAAKASEAAGAQGKFWEMHHMLFANQENLSGRVPVRLCAGIGPRCREIHG